MRYTPMRCMPVSYTLEMHAYEIYVHEMTAMVDTRL